MTQTSAVDYVSRLGLAGSGGWVGCFGISHIDGFLGLYRRRVGDRLLWYERRSGW